MLSTDLLRNARVYCRERLTHFSEARFARAQERLSYQTDPQLHQGGTDGDPCIDDSLEPVRLVRHIETLEPAVPAVVGRLEWRAAVKPASIVEREQIARSEMYFTCAPRKLTNHALQRCSSVFRAGSDPGTVVSGEWIERQARQDWYTTEFA
jgi:hypothetical protein